MIPDPVGAVLFDLDGTLVDTAEDFVIVLNHQRGLYDLPVLPDSIIRNTVSDGARALTRLAFGGQPGETGFEQKRRQLLELYLDMVGEHCQLFPGMAETLSYIENKGLSWGIVTNKPRQYAEILLHKLDLSTRCSVLVCPDDIAIAKPDPEGLVKAAMSINVPLKDCVYVGDHVRDIEAAKAAGMASIAARYGYILDKNMVSAWQADAVIDHASELQGLL